MKDRDVIHELETLKNKIDELENKRTGIRGYFKKALAKTNILAGVLIALVSTSVIVYAAQIMFNAGEVISAADVNANFTELYDAVAANTSDIAGIKQMPGRVVGASFCGKYSLLGPCDETAVWGVGEVMTGGSDGCAEVDAWGNDVEAKRIIEHFDYDYDYGNIIVVVTCVTVN